MTGKERCRILKDIRKQIAKENEIADITAECTHKGDCLGTCPRCESEVRYLERELEKRRLLGKTVTVAGLAIAVTAVSSGCVKSGITETQGDMIGPGNSPSFTDTTAPLSSEVAELGEILMGDIAYLPPPTIEELKTVLADRLKESLLHCYRDDIRTAYRNEVIVLHEDYDVYRWNDEGDTLVIAYDDDGFCVSARLAVAEADDSAVTS